MLQNKFKDSIIIRNILFIIVLTLIPIHSFSQLKKIDTTQTNGITRESYYLDTNGLKQGDYVFQFKKRNQVIGNYKDGLKTGKWIYQPDKDFKMVGYFEEDQKDSIWICYLNGKKYSMQNHTTNKKRAYFPNGDLKMQSDSINGEYHIISYSEKGKIVRKVVSTKTKNNIKEFNIKGKLIKEIKADQTFVEIKEFDKKGNIIEHIVTKYGLPYEIKKVNVKDKNQYYTGEITKGSGVVRMMEWSNRNQKYYISEIFELVEAIPQGEYLKLNHEGKKMISGQFKNGYMVGEWITYNQFTFEASEKIHYNLKDSIEYDFKFSRGFEPMNPEIPQLKTDIKFVIMEDTPSWNGKNFYDSKDEFIKFLKNFLPFIKRGFTGKKSINLTAQYGIDWDGKVVDTKIINGISPTIDNEILKFMNLSPYWRPGMQQGEPVRIIYYTNFTIDLP